MEDGPVPSGNQGPQNGKDADDPSQFDLVKACQYGVLERVAELVDTLGWDVNSKDPEGIAPLHWASINNRKDVVKFLVARGADVNAVGGELKSTPIHWAARQGHLTSIVILMRHGADPTLTDGEGSTCLHLAAEFGHTAIVAYLVAKGVDVDLLDKNGMSPLMLSARSVCSLDPTRLLLTFGADPSLQDKVEGNTPLHWALLSNNSVAMTLLIDKGAPFDVRNAHGDTIYSLARKFNINHHRLQARMKELSAGTGFAAKGRRWKKWVMMVAPFVAIYVIGAIFSLGLDFLVKLGLLMGFYIVGWVIWKFTYERKFLDDVPVAVYISTKAWGYATWVFRIRPTVSTWHSFVFLAGAAFHSYSFHCSWRRDPGIVRANKDAKYQTIIELAETTGFDPKWFCSTCLVRKPVRSKHCSFCDVCIAKFDHHCPWINNCVGVYNHKHFVWYLVSLFCLALYFIYGSVLYYQATCDTSSASSWPGSVFIAMHCDPWVAWIVCNLLFHSVWDFFLLSSQLYQVVSLGMTTNESLNCNRYRHFHVQGSSVESPFNRGIWQNLVDFCGWRCFGLCRPDPTDWMHTFDIVESSHHKGRLLPGCSPGDKYQCV